MIDILLPKICPPIRPRSLRVPFVFTVVLLTLGLFLSTAWAIEPRDQVVRVRDLKTQQLRYWLSVKLRPVSDQPGRWILEGQGQGHFHHYEDVVWKNRTELLEKDGSLWPTQGALEIRRADVVLERWEQLYDLSGRKIKFILSLPPEGTRREFSFPIKGPTTDFTSLAISLEDFIPRVKPGEPGVFLLLTSEPRLFRVHMKYLREEKIVLASGPRPAIKYRLIADMGILDNIFDRWVPPTFIWYDAAPPHRCLKYQGMETGEGSSLIDAEWVQ